MLNIQVVPKCIVDQNAVLASVPKLAPRQHAALIKYPRYAIHPGAGFEVLNAIYFSEAS
jgi:hypothetical protein